MRLLPLLLCFVSLAAVPAPAADNAPFSGKWQVHISVGGTERDQSCTFTQQDQQLGGSCATDAGAVEISGKVDEKKVTWTYKSEYNGSPLTVIFRGSLGSESKIAGTVSVEEFGVEGEFTATPSK